MWKIRSVQPQDIFSIIKLAYETLPERYHPVVFNQFYEAFPEGFLVAEQHHKIIGFIAGLKTSETIVKILILTVNPSHQHQGIGTDLFTQFLKNITTYNIKKIELEVRTTNTPAINFYKKYHFTITDTIKNFYQNGENAYIMTRVL